MRGREAAEQPLVILSIRFLTAVYAPITSVRSKREFWGNAAPMTTQVSHKRLTLDLLRTNPDTHST
jgi:hypothetical protein